MEDASLNQDILILFGTQTGTAEDLAEQLGDGLMVNDISHRIENMFDITLEVVKSYQHIFMIVSTWGEGDPPDDAEALYEELKRASSEALKGSNFAVFGLGDTGYEYFCQSGIDFDRMMEQAGSKRLLARVDADIDFDDDFTKWALAVQSHITTNIALFV